MDKSLFVKNKSLRQISRETGKSLTTVRYWFHKYRLNLPLKIVVTPDELIIDAVKKSNSLAHALRILGRAIVGSNYKFLYEAISRLNLNISHWKPYGTKSPKTKVSWNKILIENSPYRITEKRKIRLVNGGLKVYRCQICGCDPVWNKNPLNLRLDHINGKRNDNRIDNLRFVCPNCDSQLPTFCSRNKKYQRLVNSKVRVTVSKTENMGSNPIRGTNFNTQVAQWVHDRYRSKVEMSGLINGESERRLSKPCQSVVRIHPWVPISTINDYV